MNLLAQTTQPAIWFWSNLSTEQILAGAAVFALVSGILLDVIKKLGLKIIEVVFCWKSEAKQQQEKIDLLLNAAATKPTPPDVQTKIDELAAPKDQ